MLDIVKNTNDIQNQQTLVKEKLQNKVEEVQKTIDEIIKGLVNYRDIYIKRVEKYLTDNQQSIDVMNNLISNLRPTLEDYKELFSIINDLNASD